jgi:signal transduction histidine kinase
MAHFSVDTHLFRELGELLVGRDSTALVELIKNAYDADATEVTVYGQNLRSSAGGMIRIVDNGSGMDPGEFENGFLRIASRSKELGDRRSKKFKRRFTGAKGIGRLAAHKLARVLVIESDPAQRNGSVPKEGVRARIDWDKVEAHETLEELANATDAVSVSRVPLAPQYKPGTTIVLENLRRPWSVAGHNRFLSEFQSIEPPIVFRERLPTSAVPKALLFSTPVIRDASGKAGTFVVNLQGELEVGEDYWPTVVNAASWVLEIVADAVSGMVSYAVAPTNNTLKEYPFARTYSYQEKHPAGNAGPWFQARILIRSGQLQGTKQVKEWAGKNYGVRVYVEGFRVLPYGEPRNDWLGLDADVTRRQRRVDEEDSEGQDSIASQFPESETVGLKALPNRQYFGGVFLTQQGAHALRTLVNREGFVPDESYDHLANLVRRGIDLATRARAATTASADAAPSEDSTSRKSRPRKGKPTGSEPPSERVEVVRRTVAAAATYARDARRLVAEGQYKNAEARIEQSLDLINSVAGVTEELARETAMVRALAAAGTQLASFVHEVNSLIGMVTTLDERLEEVRSLAARKPIRGKDLAGVQADVRALRRMIERQAVMLIDIVTVDARRRRSRMALADRFDSAQRLVQHAAEGRRISIENRIPKEMVTGPMFEAELTAVFVNLLSNAVKAAGNGGKIRATGSLSDDATEFVVRVENTGTSVPVESGERWFKPYESTTTAIIPGLGQGMGLGLPITRRILEDQGGRILFARPSRGFATAIQFWLPVPKTR